MNVASADGAGYPAVIFGGEHADVPIGDGDGAVIGKFVAEGNAPTIIDLDGLTVGAQQRFMTAFCKEVYRRNTRPLHFVIEEADEFVESAIGEARTRIIEPLARTHTTTSELDAHPAPGAVPRLPSRAKRQVEIVQDGALTAPQLKVLRGLKWWAEMGHSAVTRPQLATAIGWSVRSSNLRDRLGELRRGGFIITDGRFIKLSAAGAKAAPEPSVARAPWSTARAKSFRPPQLRVFDAIPPAGRAIHRNDLCEAIGWSPTSSIIRDRLGELRRLGLIVPRPDGQVARADWVR
jgi:hypothetical protein